MIKIVHVISDTNIGGAGRYLLTYLAEYDRKRFDVTIVLPHNSSLEERVAKLGVKVKTADGIAEQSFGRRGVAELKKLFKKLKPDIVHSHAVLSARIAARLSGVKKVVYTRHSVFDPEARLKKGIGRMMNSLLNMWVADGIIAVADAARQNLLDTGVNDNKIKIIYNGVSPVKKLSDDEKLEVRHELGVRDGAKVVSIVARLEAVKGHAFFIEAAKRVKEMGEDVQFLIAGTGSETEALKKLVSDLQLEDTVIFTGFLQDVTGLMNITDVQANCSYGTEAASLSLLEGMGLGKPAVVSDYGGNPELISDGINGFVVPQKNSEAMAMAIIQLLGDADKYNEMSKNAEKIFNDRFTAQVMTKQMEDFYRKLLEV